jgi:hypothetical protein
MPPPVYTFDCLPEIEDGFTLDPDASFASRKPDAKHIGCLALVTASRLKQKGTKVGNITLKCPTEYDRAGIAKAVGVAVNKLQQAIDQALKDKGKGVERARFHFAVFMEPHAGNEAPAFVHALRGDSANLQEVYGWHFHIIVLSDDPTTTLPDLEDALLKHSKLRADVRVPIDENGASVVDLLNYTMLPTSQKFLLDKSPFFSKSFPMNKAVLANRKGKYSALSSRPATSTELMVAVFHSPSASSARMLCDMVDKACVKLASALNNPETIMQYQGATVPLDRLSNFFAKGEKSFDIADLLIERRDRLKFSAHIGKTWSWFFDCSFSTPCVCPSFGLTENKILELTLENVDRQAVEGRDPYRVLGCWASDQYHGTFKDR